MPVNKRMIPVIFLDGKAGKAIATGNNAAWACCCGRSMPLLGKTGEQAGATVATRVTCPDCTRHFFVEPEGGDFKQAKQVLEV